MKTIDEELEDAKSLAREICVASGGIRSSIEIVEVDVVPMSYVTNGATRLIVRVVGDLMDDLGETERLQAADPNNDSLLKSRRLSGSWNDPLESLTSNAKGSSYDILESIDLKTYRPRIKGDYWYLSEIDLQFLQDGTGILGVGSCGEPYPAYIACLLSLQNGEDIIIRRQDTFPDDAVVLVAGFMVRSSSLREPIL
jgi:hypothetical protein